MINKVKWAKKQLTRKYKDRLLDQNIALSLSLSRRSDLRVHCSFLFI
jgi:hypothetical protein